jgi:hypothetical protein
MLAAGEVNIAREDAEQDFDERDGDADADGNQAGRERQSHPDGRDEPNILMHKQTPAWTKNFPIMEGLAYCRPIYFLGTAARRPSQVEVISPDASGRFSHDGTANSIAGENCYAIGIRPATRIRLGPRSGIRVRSQI